MQRKIEPSNATPQEYLQHLRSIWTTHPHPDHVEGVDSVILDMEKKFPDLFKKALPVSKVDTMQKTLDDLYMDLSKPLEKRSAKLPLEGIAVGELQNLDVNSCCVRVPAGGYVILVNTGIMILLYQLTKIFTSRIVIEADGQTQIIVSDTAQLLEIAKYTVQTIATYLGHNVRPIRFPITRMQKAQVSFVAGILHFAELFVLAHEFGHIIEDHFSVENLMRIRTKEEDINLFRSNWNQEYEADTCGLELVLGTVGENDKKNERSLVRASSYMGPDLVFTFFDMIEKIGDIKPGTHPPAKSRRENLRKRMPPNEPGMLLGKRFEGLADLVWKALSE
jgi:hypothetical protein